ncbi:MAG: PQQ-binding-like beta-propeller repeat protein, partial [Phycisphaerales bacterium]|nr:PQQ-binding-like beta-propeller repeat protein [Phycisphaerales bacterium]
VVGGWALPSAAQPVQTPVYVDDSPAATQALGRIPELSAIGNFAEAAAVAQRLLDESSEFVAASPEDGTLYRTVRDRVHALLLGNAKLLEAYRAAESAQAQRLVEAGQIDAAERTRLLTPGGLEAALRLAQRHIESARFEAAVLTLEQLEPHPDRAAGGAASKDAALMLGESARFAYHPRGSSADGGLQAALLRRLAAWRERAGEGEAKAAPQPATLPAGPVVVGPLSASQALSFEGLLAKPMASDRLGDPIERFEELWPRGNDRSIPDSARFLHALPTVAGDAVLVNDSRTISCWDRFTLALRWRLRIDTPIGEQLVQANATSIADPLAVAVAGQVAVTLTGIEVRGQMNPERVVTAVHIPTGRVLWTATRQQLGSEALDESVFRGPVAIDQGVVVVAASKNSVMKRLEGGQLVGLDLETGRLRWVRSLASIGVVPWGGMTPPIDGTAVHGGVAYRVDQLGVIAAVESVTGRVRWIRRMESDGFPRPRNPQPWQASPPVLHEGRLFTLSPSRASVLELDPADGRVVRQMPASQFNNPDYLLVAGERLVAVGSGSLVTKALAELGDGRGGQLIGVPQPGVRGRVVVMGESLLIPLAEGLMVLDARSPDVRTARRVRLNEPGNPLALDSQLLVVDDGRIHSYVLWDEADRALSARMAADPKNAAPAVTLAELAYQAEKPERILPAADAAIRALEADALATVSEPLRARLFGSILAMVEPAHGPADDAALRARLSDDLRSALLDRLGRLAQSPRERAAQLLAAGRMAEVANQPASAVEKYQAVLDDPALARAEFTQLGRTVPAESEALWRVRRLIRSMGRGVYARFDADAERQLAALAGAEAGELEALARRYPLAAAAPRAWRLAAERAEKAGQTAAAIFSLERALAASADTLPAGDPLAGEAAGAMVRLMARSGRARAALAQLERLKAEGPAPLNVGGGPMDVAALEAELRRQLAASDRRARIGPELSGARVLAGWAIAEPEAEPTGPDVPGGAPTDTIFLRSPRGQLALFRAEADAERPGSRTLVKKWEAAEGETLLRADGAAAYLARRAETPTGNDVAIVRRDLASGTEQWVAPGFRSLFGGESDFERTRAIGVARLNTPLASNVPADEVVFCLEDRTLVLVERTGRVAAFDADSGKPLWKLRAPVTAVNDAVLSGGVLLLGGGRPAAGGEEARGPQAAEAVRGNQPDENAVRVFPGARGGGAADGFPSVVLAIEARSGNPIMRHEERQQVRWLRVAPDGAAVVGLDLALVALDPVRQQVRWRNEAAEVAGSVGAWALGGRMVVRTGDSNALLQIDLNDGRMAPQPLNARGKLDARFGRVRAAAMGDRLALATGHGVVIFDGEGRTVAADGRGAESGILPPLFTERYFVTVQDPTVFPGVAGPVMSAVQMFDAETGRMLEGARTLELPERPASAAVLDGLVLVSVRTATVVVQAPAGAPKGP